MMPCIKTNNNPSVDAASAHTENHCRLHFGESQSFKGKTFFLDLFGHPRGPRAKEIENELTCRGAVSVHVFVI